MSIGIVMKIIKIFRGITPAVIGYFIVNFICIGLVMRGLKIRR